MKEIICQNVSKRFFRGEESFEAIKNLYFQVKKGDFVTISGSSGSGKTTFLNLLAGLLIPSSGKIFIDQEEISTSEKKRALYRNKNIGWISQNQTLLSNLTVIDNVRLPYYVEKHLKNSVINIEETAQKLLNQLGVLHLANAYPQSLSGGEIQRVIAARAFINNPQLILADEPTANLDPENSEIILNFLQEASCDGATVILVSHEQKALERGAIKYTMKNGVLSRNMP